MKHANKLRRTGIANRQVRPIIYLACPYTHGDKAVRERRFHEANFAAAALVKLGHVVFSPITMTHPLDLALAGEANTLGSDYWLEFDEAFMDLCSELVVLEIDGWKRSEGIQREIEFFLRQGKPIRYIRKVGDEYQLLEQSDYAQGKTRRYK